jgi:gamma-glutamylcysteine synthetase
VDEAYFQRIAIEKDKQGVLVKNKKVGSVTIGIQTTHGETGLDNAFNLGESALGPEPLDTAHTGIDTLNTIVRQEIQDVQGALAPQGAQLLNMSNHPLTPISAASYAHRAPKAVYDYINTYRGWNHMIGIDAKAQNSPSSGCGVHDAAASLNVVMAAGAVFVGFFGNGPFSEGKASGFCDTRLSMWDGMFAQARFPGDRALAQFPEKPFANLREYFNWMHGPGTTMYFVVQDLTDYKKSSGITCINDTVSLLDFLRGESWGGSDFSTNEPSKVVPTLGHLSLHQFTQFSAARIRYVLKPEFVDVSPHDFMTAMEGGGTEVEDYFEHVAQCVYLEGRDPAATFPDTFIHDQHDGATLAKTMTLAPLAIQVGLTRNLDEAQQLIATYGWDILGKLRAEAIKRGMNASVAGHEVVDVARKFLDVAARGLNEHERVYLSYPEFVLSRKENGAQRALARFKDLEGTEEERIRKILKERFVVTA